jgi:hypothetical protein
MKNALKLGLRGDKMNTPFKIIFILCFTTTFLFAAKGPVHKSLRAYSMGNAHVAIVDDKEAIYYNYAGLSQINRLGNFKVRPQQGYYPRNYLNMRVNVGGAVPFQDFLNGYNLVMDIQDLYKRVEKAADENDLSVADVLIDSLGNHPELAEEINNYDHILLSLIAKFDAELAFHNFGGAVWVDANVAPYIDAGLVIPFLCIDTLYVDAVIQGGIGFGITNNFSLGIGVKAVKRQSMSVFKLDASNFSGIQDTLDARYEEAKDDLFDFSTISFGMDFGLLFQLTRETKFGASLRDVYFKELNEAKIDPNLSFGFSYSPRPLSSNTAFARKVNFAVDFEDALNNERNYKPLSHLNMGMEVEQTLLAWPGLNNEIRALKVRLAGGFKGGYPSGGVGLELMRVVELELATWAEEKGYYTGQAPYRVYMGQVRVGF